MMLLLVLVAVAEAVKGVMTAVKEIVIICSFGGLSGSDHDVVLDKVISGDNVCNNGTVLWYFGNCNGDGNYDGRASSAV